MPIHQRSSVNKLGRTSAQRKALFRSQLHSLIMHERIITTTPKAKALRPIAEKLITLGKKAQAAMDAGDTPENKAKALHYRRQALSALPNVDAISKLFGAIAPRFKERNGGYTRVLNVGIRPGDGGKTSLIELTERV